MRTIRQNTFETNSSSCHAVCILTDREYEDIVAGKGLIAGEDHYEEITAETVKEYFEKQKKYLEKRNVEYKEDIEKVKKLKGRPVDSLDNKEKYLIQWNVTLFMASPDTAIQNGIESLNKMISENEKGIEKLSNEEVIKKVADKVIYYMDSLQYVKDDNFDYEEAGMTEEEYGHFRDFLSNYDNIESFGYGYENSNVDSRTIDGHKVYVLSYSGYN